MTPALGDSDVFAIDGDGDKFFSLAYILGGYDIRFLVEIPIGTRWRL
jgi:hypothetical protein